MLRGQQEEEGRATGAKGDDRVPHHDQPENRACQRHGASLAARGGPVLSEAVADVLESGDPRGGGGRASEPRGLLLAAQYRNSCGCEKGERTSHFGGVVADGGSWKNCET